MTRTDPHIGTRIRDRRMLAGLSIRQTASMAGIAHTTLSRIERGERSADNRFTLAAIAGALDCPVSELCGQRVAPADRDAARRYEAAHTVVRAIHDADLDLPASEPASPWDPRQIELTLDLRARSDYIGAAGYIDAAVGRLHAHAVAGGPGRADALRILVQLTDAGAFVARYCGDVAGMALIAERGRQYAAALGDPVMTGLAAYGWAHSALACGSYARGQLIAERAADAIRPHMNRPDATEVYGMLLLTSAFARAGQRMADGGTLADAASLAATTGQSSALGLHFGPTNVAFWRVAILADGEEPGAALGLLRVTDPTAVPSVSRQAAFMIDASRVLSRTGQVREALRMLLAAERAAPQRVHGDPLVAETAMGLLSGVRGADLDRLRALCERLGAAT